MPKKAWTRACTGPPRVAVATCAGWGEGGGGGSGKQLSTSAHPLSTATWLNLPGAPTVDGTNKETERETALHRVLQGDNE